VSGGWLRELFNFALNLAVTGRPEAPAEGEGAEPKDSIGSIAGVEADPPALNENGGQD
jgi:hypothetical protein